MSFYLDTSLIVALLTPEPHSDRAEEWFAGQGDEKFAISGWVEAELAAALAAKVRAELLPLEGRQAALAAYADLKSSSLRLLPWRAAHFEAAAAFAAHVEAKLRAGDALHLASASAHRATLCTLDKRQANAGRALGLATILV